MNTACPDEERLKSLIREAFDDLVGPDPARLRQIGARLGKQAQRGETRWTRARHWLFWLLLGAAATATAWWAVKELQDGGDEVDSVIPAPIVEPQGSSAKAPAAPPVAPAQNAPGGHEQQNNSVIYRREVY
jgi:hypothetical protein